MKKQPEGLQIGHLLLIKIAYPAITTETTSGDIQRCSGVLKVIEVLPTTDTR